jgi:hypothetical protein
MTGLRPVVLRFKEMFPAAMARMALHARRSGGDLEHVALEHSRRNRVYVGPDFAKDVRAEIRAMRVANRDAEVAALRARKRRKDADRRAAEGLADPWKSATHGPLREAIVTARWDFFQAPDDAPESDILVTQGRDELGATVQRRLSLEKIAAFESPGRAFFHMHFPGQVRHLRLDLDEESPHFHALIMVTVEKTSARRGTQRLIQPSANPLLQNYEHAQDVAGLHFAAIGLTRGQEGAAARRKARAADRPAPKDRRHVSPRTFRDKRAADIASRETSAALAAKAAKLALGHAELDRTLAAQALDAATRNQRATETALERVQVAETTAKAQAKAMKRGTDAVLAEEIAYGAKTANKPERLVVGPRGPRERDAIQALRDAIQPAYDFVLNLAKRVAKLRRREHADETRAAELARRARVLDREARRLGREQNGLDDIAADRAPARLTAADFPEALAVTDRDRADTSGLQKRLDAMPNMDLYVAARATEDARLLCDDAPALRAEFARGVAVLELSAAQRGLDLETGRHDPNKATDPHRARLHVDVVTARFTPRRRPPRERQRVRG